MILFSGINVSLILSGVITISSSLGMGGAVVFEQPVALERASTVEAFVIPVADPVTADADAKVSFARESTSGTKRAPKLRVGVASFDPEAQVSKNFNVDATIKAANSEIGKSFPTGWNMSGECIMSVKRWIRAGGGNWYGAGTPIGNYAGAKEVAYKNAAPGDVIQYLSPSSPSSWTAGVHTVLVTANNGDGTLQIVESNNPGGSGLVSANKKWKPAPPNGLTFKIFRF